MSKECLIPVSVIILTKNEEANISDCLRSAQGFSQIFVVDSNSTDSTTKLAVTESAEVVNFTWNGKYPKKKQWCLDNLNFKNDWVLFLDADERISEALKEEISAFLNRVSDEYAAGEIKLTYFFMNKELKYGRSISKIALVNRRKCSFPIINDLNIPGSWEVEGHYQPKFAGGLFRFRGKILHDDNDDVVSWFKRHLMYAEWDAHIMNDHDLYRTIFGHKSTEAKRFSFVPRHPLIVFSYIYFLRRGFLDGRQGFQYSIAFSWYVWLSYLISKDL